MFRFFIMTDSGRQIIGVTSAFILIFSFSVGSENETISYVFQFNLQFTLIILDL